VLETDFKGEVVNTDVQFEPPETFNPEARGKVQQLENALRELPQFDCPVRHFFCDGIYVREITIPAGVALVGYIHMQACVTTLTKGRIAISDGETLKALEAPFSMPCAPGTKKAGYALTDVIWQDAYANPDNEHDIEKLEARLTADTHEEYLRRRKMIEVKS
jgi:hypothetical protein